jgi:signal transduction histidine kinase
LQTSSWGRFLTWNLEKARKKAVSVFLFAQYQVSRSLLLQWILLLLTFVFISTGALGFLAYRASRDVILRDAHESVGLAASARKSTLLQILAMQKDRTDNYLRMIELSCRYRGSYKATCLNRSLKDLIKSEHILGAYLSYTGRPPMIGGEFTDFKLVTIPQQDELARFGTLPDGTRYYVIHTTNRMASLTVLLDFKSLAKIISQREGLEFSSRSYLADASGFFWAPADLELSDENLFKSQALVSCLEGKNGEKVETDARGIRMIHGFRYIPDTGRSCLITQIDEKEALAPVRLLQKRINIVFTLLAMLALGSAYVFIRLLDIPLAQLTNRVRALESGDFDSPILTEGPLEVKTFADTFAAMTKTLKARVRQQAIVAQLGQRALSGISLNLLTYEIVSILGEVMGAEFCRVFELKENGYLHLKYGIGWQEELSKQSKIKIENDQPAQFALSQDEPVLVVDMQNETRFSGTTLLYERGVASGMTVKIPGSKEPYGLLSVYTARARQFSSDDVHFVQAVANMLAVAIQRKESEEALQQAISELQESNEELERFAYAVSHDLQEPLRMVSSYTQLLSNRYEGKLGADADEFIRFAKEGSLRAQRMISDLLEYARIGNEKKKFDTVSTETIFETAVSNLSLAIKESRAMVTTAGRLPEIPGDALLLTRLFQNLIMNAIKFRSDSLPDIRINAKPDKQHWLFSIHDNGIGIDAKNQDRIFEIFQRLHTRTQYPGSGIGLAICKKIVESHQGRIWVESQPGKGSTFFFTLPGLNTMHDRQTDHFHHFQNSSPLS